MSAPRIALATTPELRDALFAFRYEVYGNELAAPLGREAAATHRLCDELDVHAFNYVALDGTEVVASLRIVDGSQIPSIEAIDQRYEIRPALHQFRLHEICLAGRLAIAPRYRRGSMFLRLVDAAYSDARKRGLRIAFSDCSSYLIALYESIGYVRLGRPFEDPIFGPKHPIVWVLGDLGHMRAIQSPMYSRARRYPEDSRAAQWLAAQTGPIKPSPERSLPA